MNGGFELLNGGNSMIIGGEKMRFTSEKRPFLHKYTVQNAGFWKNWWGSVFCWRGLGRGLGRGLRDVNVASRTDIFGWGVDNWGFSAGERRDVYVADRTREIGKFCDGGVADRTGGVYLDIFGLGWLEPKERAVSPNHSIWGFYE